MTKSFHRIYLIRSCGIASPCLMDLLVKPIHGVPLQIIIRGRAGHTQVQSKTRGERRFCCSKNQHIAGRRYRSWMEIVQTTQQIRPTLVGARRTCRKLRQHVAGFLRAAYAPLVGLAAWWRLNTGDHVSIRGRVSIRDPARWMRKTATLFHISVHRLKQLGPSSQRSGALTQGLQAASNPSEIERARTAHTPICD